MAVYLNKDMGEILGALHFPKEVIKSLAKKNIKLVQTSKALKFVMDGEVLSTIDINPAGLDAFMKSGETKESCYISIPMFMDAVEIALGTKKADPVYPSSGGISSVLHEKMMASGVKIKFKGLASKMANLGDKGEEDLDKDIHDLAVSANFKDKGVGIPTLAQVQEDVAKAKAKDKLAKDMSAKVDEAYVPENESEKWAKAVADIDEFVKLLLGSMILGSEIDYDKVEAAKNYIITNPKFGATEAILKMGGLVKDKKGEGIKAVKGKYGMFDVSKMKSALTIPLVDATKVYTPVKGTGPVSRYFLMAASADLKLGCRYRKASSSMSIRLEGNISKYVKTIKNVGFGGDPEKSNYVSMHFQVDNPTIAGKAIGAIMMGLGVEFSTPVPNVLVIADMGDG